MSAYLSRSDPANWVMAVVSVLLLLAAMYGFRQIREAGRQTVVQSYTFLFTTLYSEKAQCVRRLLREPDVRALFGQVTPKADWNALEAQLTPHAERLRRDGEDVVTMSDIDQLLSAFNHVGLMLQNGHLSPEILPAVTHLNVGETYWPTLRNYVTFRRQDNPDYALHFEFWAVQAKTYYKQAKASFRSAMQAAGSAGDPG